MFRGIIFTGASGTGKSTLARWAARKWGLRELPSATKAAYDEAGVSHDEAFRDPGIMAEVQRDVYRKLANGIRQAAFSGYPFVSERGSDVLVYTAFMCHNSFIATVPTNDIDDVCKRPDVLTVYVRPCPLILAEARAADVGRRNRFLSDEWVWRVDGAIAYHLERHVIPHVTLTSPDWPDRTATIERAVSELIWGKRPVPEEEKRVFTGRVNLDTGSAPVTVRVTGSDEQTERKAKRKKGRK